MTKTDHRNRPDDILKLIIMSDLHLVAPQSKQPNMDTTIRFEAALAHAAKRHRDADLCVFAGDLADRAEPEAYATFERLRKNYDVPQCVTLGNHDDRNVYLSCTPQAETDPNRFVQCRRDIKGHAILILDSSEPGTLRGGFPDEKLSWIKVQLEDAKQLGLKVIVILHHNPSALQMPVDCYRLDDPDRLHRVLKESGAQILQVVAGHCHISTSASWGGIPCATISGNHHRVEPYLRGRTGRQECFENTGQFGVLVSNGRDCAVHFETYLGEGEPMDGALFPRKMDQAFESLTMDA